MLECFKHNGADADDLGARSGSRGVRQTTGSGLAGPRSFAAVWVRQR
jgi:hypothetical protein